MIYAFIHVIYLAALCYIDGHGVRSQCAAVGLRARVRACYVCLCVHVCGYACVCVCVCLRVYVYTCIRVYMSTCLRVCLSACLRVSVRSHTCACVVCECVYTWSFPRMRYLLSWQLIFTCGKNGARCVLRFVRARHCCCCEWYAQSAY